MGKRVRESLESRGFRRLQGIQGPRLAPARTMAHSTEMTQPRRHNNGNTYVFRSAPASLCIERTPTSFISADGSVSALISIPILSCLSLRSYNSKFKQLDFQLGLLFLNIPLCEVSIRGNPRRSIDVVITLAVIVNSPRISHRVKNQEIRVPHQHIPVIERIAK
ncbi:hypothetical protein EVAR_92336_1 [Eumeta japonica]|uniref:Uncharacterized protein n=1 Tax=Eumeta variegata TaxID=151549 RepID=A0A4C1TJG7_EUMVA|nr:hypothetical protein EVAR_92336_1 [Eumeta japonica]